MLATLLSATSVYSIVAYAMAERSRELAIRRTLGATAPEVWRFGTSDTAWCLAIGLVLGIAAAGASTTVIEGALWGVTRSDVVTYAGAGIVMIGAGLSAMAIPVRRILRTSPVALSKAE